MAQKEGKKMKPRELSQQDFMRLARFVKLSREDGKSDRRIMTMFQLAAEDLAFIDKYNDRIDHPIESLPKAA